MITGFITCLSRTVGAVSWFGVAGSNFTNNCQISLTDSKADWDVTTSYQSDTVLLAKATCTGIKGPRPLETEQVTVTVTDTGTELSKATTMLIIAVS
jgi:hypothetical protein